VVATMMNIKLVINRLIIYLPYSVNSVGDQ